jgi:hypothetical protein
MHPEASRLAKAFITDFWGANHEIKWRAVETEASLWLSPNTVLVGKRDALGLSPDNSEFFADWKTASKSKAGYGKWAAAKKLQLKAQWRMEPQALTYGLLSSEITRNFTVRWVFKTEPATTDFEWYTYNESELDWWRGELLDCAEEVRWRRAKNKWPTNLKNCTRYGEDYRCPLRDEGCHQRNFDFVPQTWTKKTGSHIAIENEFKATGVLGGRENMAINANSPDMVVLDASRVADWLGCRFYYKRIWEDGFENSNEDLEIGKAFHSIIGSHLGQIMAEQKEQHEQTTD